MSKQPRKPPRKPPVKPQPTRPDPNRSPDDPGQVSDNPDIPDAQQPAPPNPNYPPRR